MNLKRTLTSVICALGLAGGAVLATAAPAQADGPCPSGALCVYDRDDFGGDRILTRSTNSCFRVGAVSDSFAEINSYDSNLSVNAYVWDYKGSGLYRVERTLVAGGFTSDIGLDGLGNAPDWICMGNADLNDYV
ncbi:hypothetical protein GCM10029992_03460 [Glycomyces albus]